MARPTEAIINLNAICENYDFARNLKPNARALAVIKANAYGHGAIKVAQALATRADGFGVACLEEAVELRESGITKPILLLEGFFEAQEIDALSKFDLWSAMHTIEQLEQLENAKLAKPINIWLKMDIGMHRLGFKPESYRAIYQRLSAMPQVADIVMMGHFASADNIESDATNEQIRCFNKASASIVAPISLANSAGCLGHEEARTNWQRPGIMLYGASPFANDQLLARKLKPSMTLRSRIIATREIGVGESVGYSAAWTAERPSRIATVAIGYADGYPRQAKNGTPVIVCDRVAKLAGRVSMDMLSIDVTDIPDAQIGSSVELWGEHLLASDIATYCDTVPYTLFTGITRRVHKSYV